ncbi:MAG: acetate--CoA ligase family protein [Phycisphaerales bacterium]|nr:MAG: acetate--CoA ligase family protein [Phycisphaerales bacterium]
MARLHEYEGKRLLSGVRIAVPAGRVASSADEARSIASQIGGPVVVKIQAWTTGRANLGGIRFADTTDQAADAARQLLGMKIGSFEVDKVLVEQKLDVAEEYYAAVIIDDAARRPLLMFSLAGGSGVEERARRETVVTRHLDVTRGLPDYEARNLVRRLGFAGRKLAAVSAALVGLAKVAISNDARTAEINPLVLTRDGKVVAADCRVTVDDYAVYRHPELGIEIARELDHPPTSLERIAYKVETDDHRGTFYFAQLAEGFKQGDGYLGFHGAGGGGSMMSMDAITKAGFKIANFTDTSGNPSAAKVYREAMIILAQANLDGYFGSGSGVASQEQYHSAYGLAKAFYEMNLSIPAVIRLGGNSEDRAVQILADARRHLPAAVEGYRKDDTPAFCAERMRALVDAGARDAESQLPMTRRAYNPPDNALTFAISGGTVTIDLDKCDEATNAVLTEYGGPIFEIADGKPALRLSAEEVAGKDSELIACEVECRAKANDAVYVHLPIRGLFD